MPRERCNFAEKRSITRLWKRVAFFGVATAISWSAISAQELPQPTQPNSNERSSLKPSLTKPALSSSEFQSGLSKGITGVKLEPGLENILLGNEPKNRLELISLQKQQTKIAEKINLVTVNLQHQSTQGSGVIITGDGYILTAAHVAGRPQQRITVTLHDGTAIEGISMGSNRSYDAGLVKITQANREGNGVPWPHATLGTSADLHPGQWCIATGHPGGWTKDRPAVLRVGRLLNIVKDNGKDNTLITDCPLIGGDSGGPLFNLKGELIGIHSRIGVDVDDNMHVPVDVFADSWTRLVQNKIWGNLPGFKPAIGVVGATDLESNNACKISRVDSNGAADKAGIKSGDIITKFDSVPIQNFDQLIEVVNSATPHEQVMVELLRNGRRISLRLIVGVKDEHPK